VLSEGVVSLSRYAGSSDDGHWACNGFTASTVPATGLRAVGLRSAYPYLVFLLDHACAAIGCVSVHR
jgi:hypothetical protein